mmetsp:Transcript_24656/g.38339  ORF Transcript_24656/g.38339 Transcript_24656/m.38339 type:complete len:95 (-) Transcript_24656:303-587(-)
MVRASMVIGEGRDINSKIIDNFLYPQMPTPATTSSLSLKRTMESKVRALFDEIIILYFMSEKQEADSKENELITKTIKRTFDQMPVPLEILQTL